MPVLLALSLWASSTLGHGPWELQAPNITKFQVPGHAASYGDRQRLARLQDQDTLCSVLFGPGVAGPGCTGGYKRLEWRKKERPAGHGPWAPVQPGLVNAYPGVSAEASTTPQPVSPPAQSRRAWLYSGTAHPAVGPAAPGLWRSSRFLTDL